MIRDITGVSPSNIEPTILKLNKPTVNQFIQPIIANTNAIFLIIICKKNQNYSLKLVFYHIF